MYSGPQPLWRRTAEGLRVCISRPGNKVAGERGTAWAAEWDRSLLPCGSYQSDGLTLRSHNGNMMLMGNPSLLTAPRQLTT